MALEKQTDDKTLTTLREATHIVEEGLLTARRAIAEIDARLTWSNSRIAKAGMPKQAPSRPDSGARG